MERTQYSFSHDSPEKKEAITEYVPHFTEDEFLWWYWRFRQGQGLFNSYAGFDSYVPLHLCPAYDNKHLIICYVPEINNIIATFAKVESDIKSMKRYLSGSGKTRVTTPHLARMGLCTTPDCLPIFTGFEEQGHVFFHQQVASFLPKHRIAITGSYSGSDTYEEDLYKKKTGAILRNKHLNLYKLPPDFEYQFK